MTETTTLTPSEQQALQSLVASIYQLAPEQIESIALFGSKSRGDSSEDSDIDVLIIIKKEDRDLRREILRQAARISLDYDVLLSPRVIGSDRWRRMRDFSFYRNIQRESVKLGLSEDARTEKAA